MATRRYSTRKMFEASTKDSWNNLMNSIEAIAGTRHLTDDEEEIDLIDEFMAIVYDAGLRNYRNELMREVNKDYLPDMEWRMARLRSCLPLYKAEGKMPTIEEMRDFLHGVPNGLCRRPRKQVRKD